VLDKKIKKIEEKKMLGKIVYCKSSNYLLRPFQKRTCFKLFYLLVFILFTVSWNIQIVTVREILHKRENLDLIRLCYDSQN